MDVPGGDHLVSLRYGDTPDRTAGKALSLVTLVGIAGALVGTRRSAGAGAEANALPDVAATTSRVARATRRVAGKIDIGCRMH